MRVTIQTEYSQKRVADRARKPAEPLELPVAEGTSALSGMDTKAIRYGIPCSGLGRSIEITVQSFCTLMRLSTDSSIRSITSYTPVRA
jgi:hypothetical protein